jgi:hypothetical protein
MRAKRPKSNKPKWGPGQFVPKEPIHPNRIPPNSKDLIGAVIATVREPSQQKPKTSILTTIKEFIMKLDFDKMWDTLAWLGGTVGAVIAVFLLVTGMNTCQRQSNDATLNEQNAKNKSMQECIDKTQKVWECKETMR